MAFERFRRKGGRPHTASLDQGLALLHERVTNQIEHRRNHASRVNVRPTGAVPRNVYYAPDMDGQVDPGEVVWAWVPFEEDPAQGKDRPVLVLARHETRLVVAQMTSKDHDRDAAQEARWGRFWHDVGSGDWDRRGRPSEVRLDRLLLVEPASVRREGATMNREVFDGVVAALRHHHS